MWTYDKIELTSRISLIHLMIGVIDFVLLKIPNTFYYTVIYIYYPDKNFTLQSQTY